MYDLVEIEREYVYLEIYKRGILEYEGWTLNGRPVVTRIHTTGGGWEVA